MTDDCSYLPPIEKEQKYNVILTKEEKLKRASEYILIFVVLIGIAIYLFDDPTKAILPAIVIVCSVAYKHNEDDIKKAKEKPQNDPPR